MCDRNQYAWLEHIKQPVSRLVDEDRHTYVIVPRESHVKHHLLVVLKAKNGVHKEGLINCTADDLKYLGAMISRWCDVLKQSGYDRVFTGCYSDSEPRHVHFHLVPLVHWRDKGYEGKAMQWLAEKEWRSDNKPFDGLSDSGKRSRLREIQYLVTSLKALHLAKRKRARKKKVSGTVFATRMEQRARRNFEGNPV